MWATESPNMRKSPLLLLCCLSLPVFPHERGISACSPKQSPVWLITFWRHELPWQRDAIACTAGSELLHGPATCQGVVLLPWDGCISWLEDAAPGSLQCAEQPVLDRVCYSSANQRLQCRVKTFSSNILNLKTVWKISFNLWIEFKRCPSAHLHF